MLWASMPVSLVYERCLGRDKLELGVVKKIKDAIVTQSKSGSRRKNNNTFTSVVVLINTKDP